jgi:hypothetical protein
MTEQPRKATFSPIDGVHLQEHLERVIALEKTRLEEKITAVEKATTLAADVLDRRLHTMNEIRASLEDARANSPTNSELRALQKQVDGMDKRMQNLITSDQFAALRGPIDKDLRELRDSKNILAGKADRGSVLLSVGLASLSLLLSAIGAISTAMNVMRGM